jgi:hypothetical protein
LAGPINSAGRKPFTLAIHPIAMMPKIGIMVVAIDIKIFIQVGNVDGND